MCQEIIVLKKLRQRFPNSGGDNGGTPPGGKDRQQTDWKHPGTHLQLEQNGDQGSLFDKNLFDSGHPTHHHGTGGVEYEESHP